MFLASRTWFNFVPLVVHLLQGHLMESIPWWFTVTDSLTSRLSWMDCNKMNGSQMISTYQKNSTPRVLTPRLSLLGVTRIVVVILWMYGTKCLPELWTCVIPVVPLLRGKRMAP